MVQHQLIVGLQDATYRWWGERTQKYLGHSTYYLGGFEIFSQLHAGMAERLVRDLAIEEYLQIKMTATISHSSQ